MKNVRACFYGYILIAAMVFCTPADAQQAELPAAPLALWAEHLPDDFEALSKHAGLPVLGVERLEALGTNIVYIQPASGQSNAEMLDALNHRFPNLKFEILEDIESDFELVQ